MAVNSKGDILKEIDLTQFDADIVNIPNSACSFDFDDNGVKITYSSDFDFFDEKLIYIDFSKFNVDVKTLEYENATYEVLSGKTLLSEYLDTYYFNENGTFEQIVNNYIDKYSIVRYIGNWEIQDNYLKLYVTDIVIADGGHYEYVGEYERNFVDYDEKIIPADNMEFDYYLVYYTNYDGKEMVSVNEMLYEIVEPVG